jgi:branched-chain amino acid transport system ATP-binding protein
MSERLVELRDLTIRFGGISALSHVNFRAGASELIGIIGPNGAGKTTLFNVMSGIATPTAGTIGFEDVDLTGRPPHVFNRLGIARTFQTARAFRNLSVRENVQFGLRFTWRRGGRAADTQAETDGLLERLGLIDQARALAGSLPPTRQRLLEIAMALATNPRLLLLDEVAAGLTQSEAEGVASLIQKHLGHLDRAQRRHPDAGRRPGDGVASRRSAGRWASQRSFAGSGGDRRLSR